MAKLKELESREAEIKANLAVSAPNLISFLPNAAELYRQQIVELEQALSHPEHGDAAREAVRALIGKAYIRPRPDLGKKEFDIDLEGALGALLQMAGMQKTRCRSCRFGIAFCGTVGCGGSQPTVPQF